MLLVFINALIWLVISLAVLYCVYLLVNWVLGELGLVSPVAQKIVRIICVVIAFLVILYFLSSLLGGAQFGYPLLK